MPSNTILTQTQCFHCGALCDSETVKVEEKIFCCEGCRLVYELLEENNLCNYYQLHDRPGKTNENTILGDRYAYLDEVGISNQLILYKEDHTSHIKFHIPAMHCASCIWLLEHMNRLDSGIISSKSNFIKKEVHLVYDHTKTSLRKIVEKLHEIGYPPELNLKELEKNIIKPKNKSRIYKIGIAGFAFGNIMLLSFPEYFSSGTYEGEDFHRIFGYLNLILSLPVFFYSASEFLESALRSFRQKIINIDVPIAIGIVAMFSRSIYEIVSDTGPGYFDSMTGLVFFMLIGRNFQSKTYEWLSFERDYKSYFPIAVSRLNGRKEEFISIREIKTNDRLYIRNEEIIPADVLLLSEEAQLDYSFVTGESRKVKCIKGERIFAGARLIGSPIEVWVQKDVSQSYITQLWNQSNEKKSIKSNYQILAEKISKWFVLITISIAVASFAYWYSSDPSRAILAFTSVLVIACACALALSAPFTFGNMLRILGKAGIYLKNTDVLERLSEIDVVLFDKTGTLTSSDKVHVDYKGKELSPSEKEVISALANTSAHPFSRNIVKYLQAEINSHVITDVIEHPGKGIEGVVDGQLVKIGSRTFLLDQEKIKVSYKISETGVSMNGELMGFFEFTSSFRTSSENLLKSFKKKGYEISIVSGDYNHDEKYLRSILGNETPMHFEKQPLDKLNIVNDYIKKGHKVMMIGDGLNDAGALKNSDVGLAVSENINNFSPGSDGIILAKKFGQIHQLVRFAKSGHRIILISFFISILYNLIGLGFAVQGTLSPVVAAILMPISTSSLVIYTVIASSYKARVLGFQKLVN